MNVDAISIAIGITLVASATATEYRIFVLGGILLILLGFFGIIEKKELK